MRTKMQLRKLTDLMDRLQLAVKAGCAHVDELCQQVDRLADGPDCSAEEAVYLAAMQTAIQAWQIAAAAQQTAQQADEIASIACTDLYNCQTGGS